MAHVCLQPQHPPAVRSQPFGGELRIFLVAAAHHHVCSGSCKSFGDSESKSPGPTGNDGDLIFEAPARQLLATHGTGTVIWPRTTCRSGSPAWRRRTFSAIAVHRWRVVPSVHPE